MKTTLLIVLGCVGLAVIVAASLVFFIVYGSRAPEDIRVETNVPLEVTNEPFLLEVFVTNVGRKAQQFHSIDIEKAYLDGISISDAEPNYKESAGIFLYQSYLFERPLAPGKTQVIKFSAKPLYSGDWSGDLDVCVGTGARCVTKNIRTVVREIDTTSTRDDSSLVR